MEAHGASHVGRVRDHNEDSFLLDISLGLLVVADGMGGHAGGAVASRLAVDLINDGLQNRLASSATPNDLLNNPRDCARRPHSAILGRTSEELQLQGMGTTLVTAVALEAEVLVAHLGDSRAYLVYNGKLHRLTEYHSLVAQLIRIGQISEAEARSHPQRHIITQALGVGEEVKPGLIRFPPQPGDTLLICTDGQHGMIDDDLILKRTLKKQTPRTLCEALIANALAAGGEDNVTVIVAQWASMSWRHALTRRLFAAFQ